MSSVLHIGRETRIRSVFIIREPESKRENKATGKHRSLILEDHKNSRREKPMNESSNVTLSASLNNGRIGVDRINQLKTFI